jgi:hypothetical protein
MSRDSGNFDAFFQLQNLFFSDLTSSRSPRARQRNQ